VADGQHRPGRISPRERSEGIRDRPAGGGGLLGQPAAKADQPRFIGRQPADVVRCENVPVLVVVKRPDGCEGQPQERQPRPGRLADAGQPADHPDSKGDRRGGDRHAKTPVGNHAG
jgi:hypothetical protein